jgi:hypothetical protein
LQFNIATNERQQVNVVKSCEIGRREHQAQQRYNSMISEERNIIAFVNAVKDLDRLEIVRVATIERRAAIDCKDKDKYIGQKSTEYGLELGELLYMLNYDSPPRLNQISAVSAQ